MARAKTKIILELEVNTYGREYDPKTVDRLDNLYSSWLQKACTAVPNVTLKVYVPPDWEFIIADNTS